MVELHLHLDGSLSKDELKELCVMNHTPESVVDMAKLSVDASCTSLSDYLECFDFPCSFLKNTSSITYAVYALYTRLARSGIKYAEIRFAPQLSLGDGLTQDDVVLAAITGLRTAKSECDIKGNLILCLMRGGEKENNMETVRVAKEYLGRGVCAIDLAGGEAVFKTHLYEEEFAYARSLGVPFTIHAGEADGPESVWDALRFGACRIGHGVNARHDEKLMAYLAENKIPVELCPTSEVDTHCLSSFEDLPLRLFLEKGIVVTISTDDMTVSNITLKEEFVKLKKAFGLTNEEALQLFYNGIDASFASEDEKKDLREKILQSHSSWLS